jgi:hypothetical protein
LFISGWAAQSAAAAAPAGRRDARKGFSSIVLGRRTKWNICIYVTPFVKYLKIINRRWLTDSALADEFTEQQQLALHFEINNDYYSHSKIRVKPTLPPEAMSGQHILVYQRESSCHYVICRAASAPFTVIHLSAAGGEL